MKYNFLFNTNTRNTKERGVILYLALIILGGVLAIVLGVGALLVGQIKLVGGIGNAVTAFYAAEAGIEFEAYDGDGSPRTYGPIAIGTAGAVYNISVVDSTDSSCNGTTFCIKSIGTFNTTQRAVNVDF